VSTENGVEKNNLSNCDLSISHYKNTLNTQLGVCVCVCELADAPKYETDSPSNSYVIGANESSLTFNKTPQ